MEHFHLQNLDRQAYINSIETIIDAKSIGFAKMALKWWDRHFNWKVDGCIVLCDEQSRHLSYIFYKIDGYKEYITIHNLFTPKDLRRNGYAKRLLCMVFDEANTQYVKRFKLSCVSQSLDFYMTLGLIYWGVTTAGDYYCDLPMPKEGLNTLESMIEQSSLEQLLGRHCRKIKDKVEGNNVMQSDDQQALYASDTKKLSDHYRFNALMKHAIPCA